MTRTIQFASFAFFIVVVSATPAEDAKYAATTKPAVPYIQPTIPVVTDKYAPSYPEKRAYASKSLTPDSSKSEYQDDEGDVIQRKVVPTIERFKEFSDMMGQIPCDICALLYPDCKEHCKRTLEKANPSAYTK